MANDAKKAPVTDGTHLESNAHIHELAIDLRSPGTRVNMHLTVRAKSVILYLTSTNADAPSSHTNMGSFVYAMPDRYNPSSPMSTALYSHAASLDFTVRMAKLLARRLQKPCYVGNSINLSSTAGGGNVEEELEAFRAVVSTVLSHA